MTANILFVSVMCNLFMAQCLFQFGGALTSFPEACQIIGILVHYFWLSTVFSLNSYCLLVLRNLKSIHTFSGIEQLRLPLIYVYGLPTVFISINIAYSFDENPDGSLYVGYGRTQCFIDTALMRGVTFACPLAAVVVTNIIAFLLILREIKKNTNLSGSLNIQRQYAGVYFRLLTLTGLSWMIGFLNEILHIEVLEYIFIVLTAGQGVLLFAAFSNLHFLKVCCKQNMNKIETFGTNVQ